MKRFLLVTPKSWHNVLYRNLCARQGEEWHRIEKKEDFTAEVLASLQPNKIFIPHWSFIISESIWSNYECIVFHMTDLPYGRGGSPLQNLIVRGYHETMISALQVNSGIDTGDIYLKKRLTLEGPAHQIFTRSVPIIQSMIEEIIDKSIRPVPQEGAPVHFKRRKPEDGEISKLKDLEKVYDYVRMLDAEGYPKAFLETEYFKLEFSEAVRTGSKEITANVRITKK